MSKELKNKKGHPYHLVDMSPWPIMMTISLLIFLVGAILFLNTYLKGKWLLYLGFKFISLILLLWFRDIIREATFQGNHTKAVINGLKLGIILFILSEIMFFVSFFWAYLHSSLSPSIELGAIWPPKGIDPLNPWTIPFCNAIILLSSGATATWGHHYVLLGGNNGYIQALKGISLTILLGLIFSALQAFEFYYSPFTISDGIFGSVFFFGTGAHGIHVIIGTIYLIVNLVRTYLGHFTNTHHFGLESSLWYWHVIDTIYLALFIVFYVWGM